MAEEAFKLTDFADQYAESEYGIFDDNAIQRTIIVVRPLVVDQNWLVFSDDVGKIFQAMISPPDKMEVKLSRWSDFGEVDELIEGIIKEGIRIPDVPKLRDYLFNFSELKEILLSVCKLTKEKFLNNAQLSLEVTNDFGEDVDFLVLYVRQEQYDDRIMDIIDNIRSSYGDKMIGQQGWLLVTTDFSSPK